jgi:subtilisin-like proprotein convertase family protein
MIRRRYNGRLARKKPSFGSKNGRQSATLSSRRCLIETLELRQMLSASGPQIDPRLLFDNSAFTQTTGAIPSASSLASGASTVGSPAIAPVSSPAAQSAAQSAAATSSLMPQTPLPLTETFQLHSNLGATNVIYLDFVGFTTRGTVWNGPLPTGSGLPNIITSAYDTDGDPTTFIDSEKLDIQSIWERVSEDFRPFDVDVTTEDPGAATLASSGQRVVIGGSKADWAGPLLGTTEDHLGKNSFGGGSDTPAYVFSKDFKPPNPAVAIAESTSHVLGTTLGLANKGYYTIDPNMAPPPAPPFILTDHKYFLGYGTGPTAWAPIMGEETGKYDKALTQWSEGEYFQSDNVDDELATLSNRLNYRADDHGSTTGTADPLTIVSGTASSDINSVADEGIIEQSTDVDMFSFSVEDFGGAVTLDVSPLANGANLDVLAKILDSSGNVVATSNPVDGILAGSQTYNAQTQVGGWLLAHPTDPLHPYVDVLYLTAGTYFLSVQGASKPAGAPNTDPTKADSGYSNYGNLGYYSIKGEIGKNLVVGVDFDASVNGNPAKSPANWNQYLGGDTNTVLSNLIDEAGAHVPYTLSVSTTGSSIHTVAGTNTVDPSELPSHGIPLGNVDGYIATTSPDETLTFTWGNLTPATVYQIFVIGHSSVTSENQVTVTGGMWNGIQQTYSFTQFITPNGLVVNNNAPGSQDLTTYQLDVISDDTGHITITVKGADGAPAGIAGLAINTTHVGSIAGQKFDDANGNQSHDSGEAGLPGWVVYLDLNNDGQLNSTSDQNINVPAPHVPQPISDFNGDIGGSTTKNQLDYEDSGDILDLNVTLNISHQYDADLRVWLVSPTGTQVLLFANVGSFHQNFTDTTFDDDATADITQGVAPYTGTFRPQEPLSAFNGENAQGTWTLLVLDDASGFSGVLNSWSITVKTAGIFLEPFAVTDANGDYSFTDLPAGQYFVREHFSDDQKAAGWTQTMAPSPVTVRSGASVTGVDFGNWIPATQPGSISGQIFNDLDGDGVKDDNEPGLSGWNAYIDANNNGVRDVATSPTVISSTDVPKVITDFSTINSQIEYDGLGTVFNIQVTLDITHSFVGDLDAYLISPSGRQVELFTGVGGQFNDFHNLTLDDNAPRSIATLGADDVPYTGSWQPEGHLSDFNSADAAGIWTLQIRDTQLFDEGTLNSWSLKITAGEEFRTTDGDGNYTFENIPPGDYRVREEAPQGWTQIPPANKTIPAATWQNGFWLVSVVGLDDINDPNGPDSRRNVKNVNFGNQSAQPLIGDYNRSGGVSAADYILWRSKLGTIGNAFAGADGNGDGVVNAADYNIWRSNFGKVIDDFGNNAATANNVASVPATKHGTIEVPGDVDWFAFTATAGQTYDISTTLGTLSDTVLRLINTDGTTQIAQNDNANGLASDIQWTAPADGTYYAEVHGAGALTGTYTLSLQTANDDHGNFAADATPIQVPSSTPGDIESPMDHDWFSFNVVAGSTYSIDVNLDTLVDSQLSLIGSDGTTLLKFDDDSGPLYASHIDWTFAASGKYYLDVNGYGSDLGTYHVTISVSGSGAGSGALMGFASEESFPTFNSGILAFASSESGSSLSSGTKALQTTLAPVSGNNNSEAALLAWLASQPRSGSPSADADSAFHPASDGVTGDDLADSVDSVFDRIGAAAVSEALAV